MNIYCSAARLKGFERDLHLEGTQFASILGVLYVGYLTMQIPSFVVYLELSTCDRLNSLIGISFLIILGNLRSTYRVAYCKSLYHDQHGHSPMLKIMKCLGVYLHWHGSSHQVRSTLRLSVKLTR